MTGFGTGAGTTTAPSPDGGSITSCTTVSEGAGLAEGCVGTLAHPASNSSNTAKRNMQVLFIN
jgi:hypothetical protein